MKYFIDTEFLEGTQKENFPISLFRKNTPPTIDLISIGIVAEDGREYYAISKDFNLKEAWNRYDEELKMPSGDGKNWYPNGYVLRTYWLRENVLNPIFMEFQNLERDYLEKQKRMIGYAPCIDSEFCYSNFNRLLKKYGKTNKEIAKEVKQFCSIGTAYSSMDIPIASIMHFANLGPEELEIIKEKDLKFVFNEVPEFYAYYADYDWVLFCWLFGKMMDLPKGFPMYCKDLKQTMDEKSMRYFESVNPGMENFKERLESMKNHPAYPKQENEHNALDDARWNKKLHEFLTQI